MPWANVPYDNGNYNNWRTALTPVNEATTKIATVPKNVVPNKRIPKNTSRNKVISRTGWDTNKENKVNKNQNCKTHQRSVEYYMGNPWYFSN